MFTLITFKSIDLLSSPKYLLQILINLTNSVNSIAKLRLSMCKSQKNSGANWQYCAPPHSQTTQQALLSRKFSTNTSSATGDTAIFQLFFIILMQK